MASYSENSLSRSDGPAIKDNYLYPRFEPSDVPFEERYPSEISMEIMDICNLKCAHCYQRHQTARPRGFMKVEDFERLVQSLTPCIRNASSLNFTAVEALFHPRLFDMIDRVRAVNDSINIRINTNGMLLDEEHIKGLMDRGIDNFSISLDGCTRETVASIKTGIDFHRVVGNIKRLQSMGNNQLCYKTIFVAQRKNIHELRAYVRFCHDLGVREIKISGLIPYAPEMAGDCLYSRQGMPEVDTLFTQARQEAADLGISLFYRSTKLEPIGCGFAVFTIFVDQEGNIVPCNLFTRPTTLSLMGRQTRTRPMVWGNAHNDDPYAVWTRPDAVAFRKKLYESSLPEACALCALGHNVIC